jgi:hypothetical protein
MATIRKRGDKWHVQVRRKGFATSTRSFTAKADAQAWAKQTELELERSGLPHDRRSLRLLSLGDVVQRYRDSVVPGKRSAENETILLNAFLRHKLAPMAHSSGRHGQRADGLQ